MKEEILARLDGDDNSTIGTLEVTDDQRLVIEAGGHTLEFQNLHFQTSYNQAASSAKKRRLEAEREHREKILADRRRRTQNPYHNTDGGDGE